VGTGPYKIVEFKPGDVARYEINMQYHVPNRPFFDSVELKGGGDATSAARAVLQTGEFDFAWNMQVEHQVLTGLERGGKGKAVVTSGSNVEHIQVNFTDPWTEVEGERSSVKKTASVPDRSTPPRSLCQSCGSSGCGGTVLWRSRRADE
jgi:peptide/nickel transport system substrate-binding protein